MQPTVIDERYAISGLLGGGGMAEVYLAHDEVLERDVAIKLLRGQYANDEEFVARFRQEARSAASLSHPNIVAVYDQGRSENGAYYMAMEYVPGGTLKDRVRRDGALAPDTAARIAQQVASALEAAHERGVIHRDIKPQNVLVTRTGDVKVTDFGIARAASATTLTRTGNVLGTAGYMSPEQARGETVGPASDLYSLGVVLYEMLTGNLPYEADSALAQAMKHISEPPPSPREANPEVPEALDALTMKLLAKSPYERYPSARALADDLERIRSGVVPGLAPAEEKTETLTAPLPPRPKGDTRHTAVRPSAAAPPAAPVRSPGRDDAGRRNTGRRLFPALAALLFAVLLVGGLGYAYASGYLEGFDPTGSSGEQSGAEEPEAPETPAATTVTVPDLVFVGEAAGVLAGEGLNIGAVNEVPNAAVPPGQVLETYPPEGSEVEPGAFVDVVSSTGPAAQPAAQNIPPPQPASPPAAPPAAQPPTNDTPDGETGKAVENAGGKVGENEQGGVGVDDEDGDGCEGPVCLID